MRRICGVLISVLLLVVTATPIAAQSYVINPTLVQFTASPDHAVILPNTQPMVERYEIRFFAQGAAAPFQSASLGKPTPNVDNVIQTSVVSVLASIPFDPKLQYVARVAAIGSTGEGVSDDSNPFGVASKPQAPANVVLVR